MRVAPLTLLLPDELAIMSGMKLLCFLPLIFTQLCHGNEYIMRRPTVNEEPLIDRLEWLEDYRHFKRLSQERPNLLVYFSAEPIDASTKSPELDELRAAAFLAFGKATIAAVSCQLETEQLGEMEENQLCKRLRVPELEKGYAMKHYSAGDFHKLYDRRLSRRSILRFLEDPNAEKAWEDQDEAEDVIHLDSPPELARTVSALEKCVVLYYIPSCVHCRRVKPHYEVLATQFKEQGIGLAAINLQLNANRPLAKMANITAFPTIEYFEKGKQIARFSGIPLRSEIASFIENPLGVVEQDEVQNWADDESTMVDHLSTAMFSNYMTRNPSVVVMFYAPWCGHCKRMKPEYEKAAKEARQLKLKGRFAAMDATQNMELCAKLGIQAYPTLKFFDLGEPKANVNLRSAKGLVNFLKDPRKTKTEAGMAPWDERPGSLVIRLHGEKDAADKLKDKKHSLVFFYLPGCLHCKTIWSDFDSAADAFKLGPHELGMAAVDCAKEREWCLKLKITHYPSVHHFMGTESFGDYEGARQKDAYILFLLRNRRDEL